MAKIDYSDKDKPKLSTTEKRANFVDEYLLLPESPTRAKRAAKKAGYAEPNKIAKTLMEDESIVKQIEDRRKGLANRNKVTLERVAEEYAKIAFADPSQYYKFDKKEGVVVKPSEELDLTPVKDVRETRVGRGKAAHSKIAIEFHDKPGALKALREMYGYDAPTKTVSKSEVKTIESKGIDINKLRESIAARIGGAGS